MKKILFTLSVIALIVACGGNKKDKNAEEVMTVEANDNFKTYKYKVVGLQDSVVSDSIWRIIFQIDGIDKLVLSREDSMAVFTVDKQKVSDSLLKAEIVSRGGLLVE